MSYVFAAYSIIWLGVLWYVFLLARDSKRLKEQLAALEAAAAADQQVGRTT